MPQITLSIEERDRLMSIHDRLMGSLRDSRAAHETAKATIEAQAARIAELEAENAALRAAAIDEAEVARALADLDRASAAIRDLVGPPPEAGGVRPPGAAPAA